MGSKCCTPGRIDDSSNVDCTLKPPKTDLIRGKGHKDQCEDFNANPDGAKKVAYWKPYNTKENAVRQLRDFDYDNMDVPAYADLHIDGPFLYSADESLYLGQFQDNKRHGRGKSAYKNGSVYEGEWSND